jgi:hypothetical protein
MTKPLNEKKTISENKNIQIKILMIKVRGAMM